MWASCFYSVSCRSLTGHCPRWSQGWDTNWFPHPFEPRVWFPEDCRGHVWENP